MVLEYKVEYEVGRFLNPEKGFKEERIGEGEFYSNDADAVLDFRNSMFHSFEIYRDRIFRNEKYFPLEDLLKIRK
jgi:hypothetical protein